MNNTDQVVLHKLIFSLNWEDPLSDIKALKIQPRETLMTITSGCCNSFDFLLRDPSIIYAVDINPAQSFLMELKIAAFQILDYDEFADLMGLTGKSDRHKIYMKLRHALSEPARQFWDGAGKMIHRGIIMAGRYESFVTLAGRVIRILQGKKIVLDVFGDKSPSDQVRYFDLVFNTWRFRSIFPLLFNKRMLANKGLSADYFYFDDGSKSFAESFYNRAKNVMRNIPVKENYFLALYLLGKYRNRNEVPEYLKEKNFGILKQRVDRIQVVTMDAKEWLSAAPGSTVDCFSLSNICELKSETDTGLLFNEIIRVGRGGGRVCFRNLMIPREVPAHLQNAIIKDTELSKQLLAEDRSFVYGKVAAYALHKSS